MTRTLIRGGTVVSAADERSADVLIDGERIVAVAPDLAAGADRVIDATGRLVLPGGIDPHTHMGSPIGPQATCDDFTSGTASAAAGGTTTIVDFAMQPRGRRVPEAVGDWHAKLEQAPPHVDVGFHLAVTDISVPGAADDLAALPGDGITSVKLFLAYRDTLMVDDEVMSQVMHLTAGSGGLVMVHAENGGAIETLIERARRRGELTPPWHARTRPMALEAEATARAITLADVAGCPVYIVHISCGPALDALTRAQDAGADAWGETCPHYLRQDERALDRPGLDGALAVCSPPLRPKGEQEALWAGLSSGRLAVLATDHCPYRRDQKQLGVDDFTAIPNGVPGVENRLMLLHHHGVRTGRLSMSRLVELCCEAPARLFGLAPRKGTIAEGADADVVIFDPQLQRSLSAATHRSRCDYHVFEGETVTGAPEIVMVRGTVVFAGDEVIGPVGHGRFLARGRPEAP